MSKKILLVITKSNWGGAQRYVYDLATNLGGEYTPVVATGGKGALTEKLEKRGVRTIMIPGLQRDISFTREVAAFFSLIQIFRNEQPDIVHLNSSKAGALGALAARLAHVARIVFTVHGWPYHERVGPLSKTFRWFASLTTMLLAHATITVSRFDARTAPLGLTSSMIHNGIGPLTLGSGEKIRHAFPPGTVITGVIGELTKNKNQQELINAAQSDPSLFVAIVGEGEDRAMLENQIQERALAERVKLFGFLPVEDALPGFDRFALPSLKEGLPYVLLEARVAGLPITANHVGGISEILDGNMADFTLDRMLRETIAVYEH